MKKFYSICLVILRVLFVFICVIFFPLGLVAIGYLLGKRSTRNKIVVNSKNNAELIEKTVVTESESDNSVSLEI